MRKPKDFDCVEMKWQIQRQLAERYAGAPEEEARRQQWEAALADAVLGPFLAKVLAKGVNPPGTGTA
jgi:hypothetical protein